MRRSLPSGRLTLSWVGKDQSLLGTPDGGYEWVDRDDPRVTEVRLLHERKIVGDVAQPSTSDNLLIIGDSYDALHALVRIPEYAERYLGKVKLVYIDPPFNTGQAFAHYDDALEHSVWLTMIRDRLLLIRELLAPDGSVWIHLDDTEMPYCRILMDEVFGRQNFLSHITLEINPKGRQLDRFFAASHDHLFIYAKSLDLVQLISATVDAVNIEDFPLKEPDGRKYRRLPLRNTNKKFNPETRPNLHYPFYVHPDTGDVRTRFVRGYRAVLPVFGDGNQAVWRWSAALAEERGNELVGKFVDGRLGKRLDVFQKDYHTDARTKKLRTIWPSEEIGSTDAAKREIAAMFPDITPFATPKPERLIQRIIDCTTEPNELVLDCFAGSGTTAAVAHKMGRHWVAIEKESPIVETFTSPRLEKVVNGEDPGGVTETVGWQKGGGFCVFEVRPSIYEVQGGRALLAERVTNGLFAESVAAQLGFQVDHDAPFCGRKGRSRLVVLDGVVDEEVVRAVVSRLSDDERAVLVGKGATPDASNLLTSLSPGSRLRKAPHDLLERRVVR